MDLRELFINLCVTHKLPVPITPVTSDFSCIFDNIHSVIYYTPTETLCKRNCGDYPENPTVVSIRIIAAKKPRDSLLCAENFDELDVGERLRVFRLRAGLKIDEAAKAVGIDRGTLMNYELGRVGRMKRSTLEKLFNLYK